MTEHRMLDFVRALVIHEPNLAPPSVTPVRFQVRTGFTAPPKEQMRSTNYKVLTWKYRVKDLKYFAQFLDKWEKDFSDWFHLQAEQQGYIANKDPSKLDCSNLVIAQSYLGTFPARSPGGAAVNHFNTAWGGTLDGIAIVEKCRVALPASLTSLNEVQLAKRLSELLENVSGDVEVEILDPSIGF